MTEPRDSGPLDYASPRDGDMVSPLPTIIAYSIVYLVIAAVAFFAEPRVEQFAKDMKMDLPGYTKLFFTFNRWFREDLGWLWLLPIPVAIPVALTRRPSASRVPAQARHWRLAGITSIVLLVIGIAVALAIVAPVYQLMNELSGPARKP